MEIPFPGDEVTKTWPPSAPAEEQARFIFRVPDYKIARGLIETIESVAAGEIDTADGWRVFVGRTLERVENLKHDGEEIKLEHEDGGSLTEECAGRILQFMPWLFRVAQGFVMLPEADRKNS